MAYVKAINPELQSERMSSKRKLLMVYLALFTIALGKLIFYRLRRALFGASL